jgi:hypothetical protein
VVQTGRNFEGPLFRDVLKAAGSRGSKLYVVALNDYAAEIPLADLEKYDVILARKINGKVLTVRDKGRCLSCIPSTRSRNCAPRKSTPAAYGRLTASASNKPLQG